MRSSALLRLAAAAALSSFLPCQRPAPADDGQRLAAACNTFAADLHRRLDGATPLWSPASAAAGLLMLLPGARGATADELAAALHLPDDLRGERLLRAARQVIGDREASAMRDGRILGLRCTNDLWVPAGHVVEASYADAVRAAFGASVRTFDAARGADATRDGINGRIAEASGGRIPELLPRGVLGPATHHVLTSALWYRGAWDGKFGKRRPEPFHLDAERTIDAAMMHKTDTLRYAESDDWQAVALELLPGPLEFALVVPKENRPLAAAEATLFAEDPWRTAPYRQVDLTMPAFTARAAHRLRAPLLTLGLRAAFSPGLADFTGIDALVPLHVDEVLQAARIDVDERGVEAAAASATGVTTAGTAGPGEPERPVVVVADHPFAWALRDKVTGLLLFAGRVLDPRPH